MFKLLDLDKNKYYLLACSFGPDSMALFHMLKSQGYKFMVAHVNYNARIESQYETESLNNICAQNDVEIEIYHCKTPISSGNFEAKAREIRYNFFKDIYFKNKIDALLVAHQQDDVIETYYLQRQRGGYVDNYGLIREVVIFDMLTIRPLLDYTKEELLAYCQNNHVPYAIDSSNLKDDFSRNIIRHNIVSKLNERDRKAILEEIKNLNNHILDINKKLKAIDLNSKYELLKLNDEEFQKAMILLARNIKPGVSISNKLAVELKKIITSSKPNVHFKIQDGLIFNKEYDWINFISNEKNTSFSYILNKPSKLETQYFYLDFTNDTKDKNIAAGDYPLLIRNAFDDDEIIINNYKVKVRRLFIDWKMPITVRKKWPVIVNKDNKIVYIPRYRKDFKISEDLNFYVKL